MTDLNILVVEDEVIIASSLQEMLSDLGYNKSQRINNFSDAKAAIDSDKYDLVILDINLEGNYEGLELGQLCNEKFIPHFFLTSYSDKETFQQAKSSKPGSYVIKPFNKNEIMVAVELSLVDSSIEIKTQVESASQKFKFSKREQEIVLGVVRQMTNTAISEELSLSPNTIKYHLRNIFSKMGTTSKAEVIQQVKRL